MDGEDQEPSVSLRLVGVDVESTLDQLSSHDSEGARVRMVRDLLGEALGLDTREALLPDYSHVWRGRRRQVDLAFANVRDFRDLPDGEFRASLDRPKVVIDYPFDPAGPDGLGPTPRVPIIR
ncbi:MAG: hypothetical protein ACR2KP_20785 [Egibacteraceae bacterium]